MRVLHVPFVGWNPADGVARSCLELAAAMPAVESHLVCDRAPGESASAFAAHHVISGWTPIMPLTPAFKRLVQRLDPDVVHLHGGELAPAFAYAPALAGRAVVASCYGIARAPHGFTLSAANLREHRANVSPVRLVAAKFGVLALSRRALRTGRVAAVATADARVEAAFAEAGPVVRIQGAARVSPMQARWSDDPVVVFAGRAQSGRGVDDLIAAFERVRLALPRARLRLLLLPGAGAAGWQAALEGKSWADVRLGALDDLDAQFAECQLAAFPFRWSVTLTPALAAAEAMAAGLPVVATTVECLSPLIEHGVNGALVAPEEPTALAEAIVTILTSPERWQPQSEAARKTIEESWAWPDAARDVQELYRTACNRRSTQ
jgi:glycosyltransferase involved in cell wall biosynthesis